MSRRPEFKVISPRPRPGPSTKRSKPKLPTFAVVHKSLGEGQLVGLRLGESGTWLVDVVFHGTRRTLQLREELWATATSDILKLRPHFPPPKPVKEANPKASPVADEERETEDSDESTEDDAA
jgi:hypothetical protein